MTSEERISEICARNMDGLIDHVDSAILLVCYKNEDGETASLATIRGNYYANRGLVDEWIDAQRERVCVHIRKKDEEE